MTSAQSFSFAGADPEKAARAFVQAARRVTRPSGAVIFAAGNVVNGCWNWGARQPKRCPACQFVWWPVRAWSPSEASLRANLRPPASFWSGGKAEPFSVSGGNAEALGSQLSSAIRV